MANSVIDGLGRAWIPREMLTALGIEGAAEIEVTVDSATGTLVLRSAGAIPDEDYSHYTPEARESFARAMANPVRYRVSSDDLERLGEDPDFIEELRTNPAYRDAETAAAPGRT
jgi:bifunctional DNA-binding transcriptional regulator/antitoxin component of YhaV-PrlF toxin-antitoxin module